ncbi:MAG: hypothetical protein P4L51_18700 [Puia sp.]|nr:hypothetical protein [Puia sp.]
MKHSSATHRLLEWLCRVFFSIDLVLPGVNNVAHYYPIDALIVTFAGFWLYVYKLKSLACILLVSAALINYQHLGSS